MKEIGDYLEFTTPPSVALLKIMDQRPDPAILLIFLGV